MASRQSELLRELAIRRAWLEGEVASRRERLKATPDRPDRNRLEHEIVTHAAAALELESLEQFILGRAE